MPEKKTREAARRDRREGKSASTQAGEYVHEEIEHIREGKHGARSTKQAIAIGLSKARADGIKVPAKKGAEKSTAKKATRKVASKAAKKSSTRSAAAKQALKREPRKAASKTALSRQAKKAAGKRSAASRSASARKAARTRARTAK